jgi:hypothetical protein
MTTLSITLLKKFNVKFMEFISRFRQLAPQLKDIIIIEDMLNFCLGHGNPEIPVDLFVKYIYPYKMDIYKKDDTLFRTNWLLDEINRAIQIENNKKQNNKDVEIKISKNLDIAKEMWDNFSNEIKEEIWTRLQILVKLSEKYIEELRNEK